MPNFDSFGFNGETSNGDGKPTDDITDLDTGKTGQLDADGNPIDDITGGSNGNGNSKTNANKMTNLHPPRGVSLLVKRMTLMLNMI